MSLSHRKLKKQVDLMSKRRLREFRSPCPRPLPENFTKQEARLKSDAILSGDKTDRDFEVISNH